MRTLTAEIEAIDDVEVFGRVKTVQGLLIEVVGPVRELRVGGRVSIETVNGGTLRSEIIGFRDGHALCLPFGPLTGVRLGCKAVFKSSDGAVYPADAWLGRVINADAEPIDGKGPLGRGVDAYPLKQTPLPAHQRARVGAPMDLGVRSLNTFTTMCEGQRMGIFAGSSVGKSVLMSMMVRNAAADVAIVGLIGERGREVQEFVTEYLGEIGIKRAIVVVATSDEAALMRRQAAYLTLTLAEYFRDQGKRVLFLMDSVTRFARAQREIGLAAGEPPTRRGFPPSVFSTLPKLMERVGMNDKGSVTAMYTVLVEGDDMNEPVADETRSILDGHIILSRKLAAQNHYPAIDILASKSRVMTKVVERDHQDAAGKVNEWLALYNEVELLVKIGEYQTGSDPRSDKAIAMQDRIRDFLRQRTDELEEYATTLAKLKALLT